ncbi:hypothetical protein [Chryseobacterium fistulae]|uniref:Uncharacterized protein n=1 Tax=Chryseobacterium fistulae TaxID=2675058 RepID=A0A6N4XQ05_9FLAO|nr:hypothetical protein [Chryseobacterium fistulae]CAA7389949.1 hypothetical protein CHRY9393_02245 [Chryseobacterium fistulae]
MRKFISILIIVSTLLSYQICRAQSSPKYIEVEWQNGSEAAKRIMISKFYYDPLDSWSPFGNDVGSDTYYLYCDWKREHSNQNVKGFLEEELINFGYPGFDLYIDGNDPEKLKGIVDTMVNKYIDLNAINNIVISLAFSQLFLDGRIEREIKKWAEAAFSRELMYLDFWDSEKGEMEKRQKRMNQLLSDLRKG